MWDKIKDEKLFYKTTQKPEKSKLLDALSSK
jgi:hypothetical protein